MDPDIGALIITLEHQFPLTNSELGHWSLHWDADILTHSYGKTLIPLNPLCIGTLIPKWDVDDLKQIFTEILIPTWRMFTSFPIHLWIGTLILNWDIDLFILFSYLDMIYHATLNKDTSFYLGVLGHSFHQFFIYYRYSVSHVSFSVVVVCHLFFSSSSSSFPASPFWDRVLLYSSYWPGTSYIDQAVLKLRNLYASAFWVLRLKACVITPGNIALSVSLYHQLLHEPVPCSPPFCLPSFFLQCRAY